MAKKPEKNKKVKPKNTLAIIIVVAVIVLTVGGCVTCVLLAPDSVTELSVDEIKSPTNQSPVVVSGDTGGLGVEGAKIEIYLDGQKVGETTADSDGKFSLEVKLKDEREYKIKVKASKNDSHKESSEISVTYDITPPKTPRLLSKLSEVTTNDKVSLDFQTESNCVVILYRGGEEVWEEPADENGKASLVDVGLEEGLNKFKFKSEDAAGNGSKFSKEIRISYKPKHDSGEEGNTVMDKLWLALDSSIKTREGYNISFNKKNKTATLVYTKKDSWDENSFARDVYSTLVKYGKEAFQISGVSAITVKCKTGFTDKYGKSKTEVGMIVTMPKKEFSRFDWDNLNYQPIYKKMESSCSKHYIHPAIWKNLDYDDVFLSI